MVEKIFFQSSMPRSGSTLFQNLMGQNSDFYVTPTSGALELVFSARQTFSTSPEFKAQEVSSMQKAFSEFCKQGLLGYYNSLTDKKYVLDKSRGWGVYRTFLDSFYPNPKIICLVKDLRSIISSYEKIYRKQQATQNFMRNDATAEGTTVHKRVDIWVNPINNIGRSLERLFEITRLGYKDKIHFVKFEDLCLYPEQEMEKIYEYLELPFYEHDFDNIQQITKEDDSVYGLTNDLHTISPKLELVKSDAKEILGQDICDWLYTNYKWYFDMFNYKK